MKTSKQHADPAPSPKRGRLRHVIGWSIVAAFGLIVWADAPPWWTQRSVFKTGASPSDYAIANQGQLKHFARAARDEMELKVPGGAGVAINTLVDGWTSNTTNASDYAGLSLGQLKSVAKLYHDRLKEAALVAADTAYPWEGGTAQDYAVANLGQMKHLFSFALPSEVFGPQQALLTPGSGSNVLNWTHSSIVPLSFEIEFAEIDGQGVQGLYAALVTVGPNVFTYTHTFSGTHDYVYRIRAIHGGSQYSDWAVLNLLDDVAPSAPAAPTLLALASSPPANPTAHQAVLTWQDNAGDETGFVVFRAVDTGSPDFSAIGSTPTASGTGSTVTYTDAAVDPGVDYVYKVVATVSSVHSAESNVLSVSIPVDSTLPPYQRGQINVRPPATGDPSPWVEVSFPKPYPSGTVPVVFVSPPTNNNRLASLTSGTDSFPTESDSVVARVKDVTETGFKFQLEQWTPGNAHAVETVGYLAIPVGTHNLAGPNGTTRVVVNRTTLASSPLTVTVSGFPTNVPVAVTQLQTAANTAPALSRVTGISLTQLNVQLQAQHAAATLSSNETVGYLLVQRKNQGNLLRVGSLDISSDWTVVGHGTEVRNPLLLAAVQTANDADAATLRLRTPTSRNSRLRVEEQGSAATHAAETVGWVLFGEDDITSNEAEAHLQVNEENVTAAQWNTWRSVSFKAGYAYRSPVVVLGPLSAPPTASLTPFDPALVKVRNVTSAGFEYQVVNWGNGGSPTAMTLSFSWLVMEEGSYSIGNVLWEARRLPGIEAQRMETSGLASIQHDFWNVHSAAPSVLASVVTSNSDLPIVVRTLSPAATVDLPNLPAERKNFHALRPETSTRDKQKGETVHAIVVQNKPGRTQVGLTENGLETSGLTQGGTWFRASTTAKNFNHNWRKQFLAPRYAHPFIFSNIANIFGSNPASVRLRRYQDQTGPNQFEDRENSVDFKIQEENVGDPEETHNDEELSWLAISNVPGTAVDADNDLLPDDWEDANNTYVATADPDNDGFTNLDEYENGTSPKDANNANTPWSIFTQGSERDLAVQIGVRDSVNGDDDWHVLYNGLVVARGRGMTMGYSKTIYIPPGTVGRFSFRVVRNTSGGSGMVIDLRILNNVEYQTIGLWGFGPLDAPYNGFSILVSDDGDGMPGWWELQYGFDPAYGGDAYEDPDGDGLNNLLEYLQGTDPTDADTNNDGVSDGRGYILGLNLTDTDNDADNDGLTKAQEEARGTLWYVADTDGDGVNDGADAFPLDPTQTTLTASPGDTTPPGIQLLLPPGAVLVP